MQTNMFVSYDIAIQRAPANIIRPNGLHRAVVAKHVFPICFVTFIVTWLKHG